MNQRQKFSVFIGTASMVAILSASFAQMLMLSIPGFNLQPGQDLTVRINITDPEEFSLAKIVDSGGQQDIQSVFLQYIKGEGLINVTDYDSRIYFIGNASLGQAWFRFDNVNTNDSGTYGVLYKRANSADIFKTTFEVNVTRVYAHQNVKVSSTKASDVLCLALPVSPDRLLLSMFAAAVILMQL